MAAAAATSSAKRTSVVTEFPIGKSIQSQKERGKIIMMDKTGIFARNAPLIGDYPENQLRLIKLRAKLAAGKAMVLLASDVPKLPPHVQEDDHHDDHHGHGHGHGHDHHGHGHHGHGHVHQAEIDVTKPVVRRAAASFVPRWF